MNYQWIEEEGNYFIQSGYSRDVMNSWNHYSSLLHVLTNPLVYPRVIIVFIILFNRFMDCILLTRISKPFHYGKRVFSKEFSLFSHLIDLSMYLTSHQLRNLLFCVLEH